MYIALHLLQLQLFNSVFVDQVFERFLDFLVIDVYFASFLHHFLDVGLYLRVAHHGFGTAL